MGLYALRSTEFKRLFSTDRETPNTLHERIIRRIIVIDINDGGILKKPSSCIIGVALVKSKSPTLLLVLSLEHLSTEYRDLSFS